MNISIQFHIYNIYNTEYTNNKFRTDSYLPITSTPCSLGGSQAILRAEQLVAMKPRLDGGSGGRAVLRIRLSDFAVRMNALTNSLPVASGSVMTNNRNYLLIHVPSSP